MMNVLLILSFVTGNKNKPLMKVFRIEIKNGGRILIRGITLEFWAIFMKNMSLHRGYYQCAGGRAGGRAGDVTMWSLSF